MPPLQGLWFVWGRKPRPALVPRFAWAITLRAEGASSSSINLCLRRFGNFFPRHFQSRLSNSKALEVFHHCRDFVERVAAISFRFGFLPRHERHFLPLHLHPPGRPLLILHRRLLHIACLLRDTNRQWFPDDGEGLSYACKA